MVVVNEHPEKLQYYDTYSDIVNGCDEIIVKKKETFQNNLSNHNISVTKGYDK
jgi:hypothetical protein